MGFQIIALESEEFSYLDTMTNAQLEERSIDRKVVESFPGYPCRVTLEDAPVGETVYLLNYSHLEEETPYRSSHAIYVRPKHKTARPEANEIPEIMLRRPISLRGFDQQHRMIEIGLAEGLEVKQQLEAMFENPQVDYIHLHNALPGCFAAKAIRT